MATSKPKPPRPRIGIIMGSHSDWETMRHAAELLDRLGVAHETRVVSAHRTPDLLFEYAAGPRARDRGPDRGGRRRRAPPGMAASKTALPVLGVPVQSKALSGLDSLLSIVQMPAGVPVATFAIGASGAANAALFACCILGISDPKVAAAVAEFRAAQTNKVLDHPDPKNPPGESRTQ